ncbi:MAG: hypothetical protein MJZ74_04255 [Muribaculaceae bacterium]|nr:hypothetical protein [Muribaculaceae bacterium]
MTKKLLFIATFLIGTFTVTGCMSKSNNQEGTSAEAQTEVTEGGEFSTPDLQMYDLCGHVSYAKIVVSRPPTGAYLSPDFISFTEEGYIDTLQLEFDRFSFDVTKQSMTKDSCNYTVQRDNDKRMTVWKITNAASGTPTGFMDYTFTWNDKGKVSKIGYTSEDGNAGMLAYYNDKGVLEKQVLLGFMMATYKYSYTKFDSHGNWTERQVEWYDSDEKGNEGELEDTFTETRYITYYDE